MEKIRVLLVDDHKMFRDGLKAIIHNHPGMLVVGEAKDGRGALLMASRHTPDVVVMDISMPELNGIEATRLIMAELPHVKIIALSMHTEKVYVQKMLRAGVSGYLLKDSPGDELVECIQLVCRGLTYLSPRITGVVVQEFLEHSARERGPVTLSAREREVLQLIAEGHSSKQISERLHISIKTAESHRKNIMAKLELYTVAELTKFALREGLTSLEG